VHDRRPLHRLHRGHDVIVVVRRPDDEAVDSGVRDAGDVFRAACDRQDRHPVTVACAHLGHSGEEGHTARVVEGVVQVLAEDDPEAEGRPAA